MSVAGKAGPEMVNPAPDSATESMVTDDVPDETSVSDFVDAEFTVTLPNASEPALTVSPGVVRADPVPLKETIVEAPLDALVLIVMAPLARPAAVG